MIIGFSAIISPILTALINNRHQLKLKKIDLAQENYKNTVAYQKKVLENYLKYAGRRVVYNDADSKAQYGECYYVASLYVDESLRKKMIKIHELLDARCLSTAAQQLAEITPEISELLKTL